MGGILIRDILAAGKQRGQSFTTLVLQPNTDETDCAEVVNAQQVSDYDEPIVQEDRHFYEIIAAEPGNNSYLRLISCLDLTLR